MTGNSGRRRLSGTGTSSGRRTRGSVWVTNWHTRSRCHHRSRIRNRAPGNPSWPRHRPRLRPRTRRGCFRLPQQSPRCCPTPRKRPPQFPSDGRIRPRARAPMVAAARFYAPSPVPRHSRASYIGGYSGAHEGIWGEGRAKSEMQIPWLLPQNQSSDLPVIPPIRIMGVRRGGRRSTLSHNGYRPIATQT